MSLPQLHLVRGARDEGASGGDGDARDNSVKAVASFTRTVTTPAAWPWRQHQIAQLDALHGSPLPADQVEFQLTRVGSWQPARPASFTIIYTRADPARAGRKGLGRGPVRDLLTALLPGPSFTSQRIKPAYIVTLAYVAAALLFAFALSLAWQSRLDTAAELDQLQQRSTAAKHAALEVLGVQCQSQALLALGVRTQSPGRVLADMAWVSHHLAPNVAVVGFHWRSGVAAVEVVGTASAFVQGDRGVQRASKPLRQGVWLWGVEPAVDAPASR